MIGLPLRRRPRLLSPRRRRTVQPPRSRQHLALVALATGLLAGSGTVAVFRWTAADAAGFAVNSTDDDADLSPGNGLCNTGQLNTAGQPECTLRAAIQEANASPAADTINFAIPGAGPTWTIAPTSGLPTITAPVTLDATTQTGWTSTPVVVVDGVSAGGASGLVATGSDVTIRGFAVGRFATGVIGDGPRFVLEDSHVGTNAAGSAAFANTLNGISLTKPDGTIQRNLISGNTADGLILDGGDRARVVDNRIGTTVDGNGALGNGQEGIEINSSDDVVIGEPGNGNVISGNDYAGVNGWTGSPTGVVIQSNLIGVGADGTTPLPNGTLNGEGGIVLRTTASGWLIGGTTPAEGNVIVYNDTDAIQFENIYGDADDIAILGNAIHASAGLGIDIGRDGVTPNDSGDVDTGINGVLNFPVISSATVTGATVDVSYSLDVPAGDYRVELFANPSGADPSGYGEGETFVHAETISHAGSGSAGFTASFAGTAGDIITATVTEDLGAGSFGSTSEFSPAETVADAVVTVNSTSDGNDTTPGDGVCWTGSNNSEGAPACTVRAAIQEANASAVIDTIHFDIPTSDPGHSAGVWTISLLGSSAVRVSTATTIDATTQPGYVAASTMFPDPIDGAPVVRIDRGAGSTIEDAIWLDADADGSLVRGLSITGFAGANASAVAVESAGVSVVGNWLGVGPDGSIDANEVGVDVGWGATDTVVGGPSPADRNRIVGNSYAGVAMFDTTTTGTVIKGNEISGNGLFGVVLWSGTSGHEIGGVGAGDGNIIEANDTGILVDANATASFSAILGNRIVGNAGLGIDLLYDGVTANDTSDVDTGPNDLLNFPEISSVVASGATVDVSYSLDVPAGDYRIEFFANPSGADTTGYGEGEVFVHAETISHAGSGSAGFTASFAGAAGDVITATATEDLGGGSYGSTSEYSLAGIASSPNGGPAILDDIQKGSVVLANGSSSTTVTIDAVDMAKSFLTFSLRADRAVPDDVHVTGVLTNATTVTFARADVDSDVTIEWSVVEFASGVTVQRGTVAATSTTVDVPIAAVDLTTSFPLVGVRAANVGQATFGADDFTRAAITSSTNLRLSLATTPGLVAAWQVITYNDSVVQTGTVTFAAGDASTTASVTAFDPTKSWLTYSLSTDAGTTTNIGQKLVRGLITNSTTLTFDRSNTGQAMTLRWYLIEFTDATEVQHGSANFPTSTSTVDIALASPVRPERSIGAGGSPGYGGSSSYAADDNPGVAWFTMNVVDASTLRLQRANALAPADLGWFVIHWPCPDSDSDGLCDSEEDADLDLDGDPSTTPGPDTDADTLPNYLDADDDGDSVPTASENADPNGDGDPRDAIDSDRDGQPDWLDIEAGPSSTPVADERKISATSGGLVGPLDDGDELGQDVTGIGDLDGDGVDDLVVGVPLDDDGGTNRGAVYVLFLNADGTVKAEQKISDTAGGFTGVLDDFDEFGHGIATIGDVDGDGITDIAVGTWNDGDGGPGRGAVWVLLLERDGTVKADQKISDTTGGLVATLDDDDRFGSSLTGVGDLDGDGTPDLAVGARWDDDGGSDRGATYILFLNRDGSVRGEQKISDTAGELTGVLDDFDEFGHDVDGIGDLDGDGIGDLAVGVPLDDDGGTDRGAVHVLFLDADGTVRAEQKLSATAGPLAAALDDGDWFGSALAGIGDLDGNGTPDLAVGARGDTDGAWNAGAVHLLRLAADGTLVGADKISATTGGLTGPLDVFDHFGRGISSLGDLDGDGTLNLAVSARYDDDGGPDRGAVYVLDLERGPMVVNSTGDASDGVAGDGICDTGATNSEGDPECTLRAAIEEANALGEGVITFGIPTSDANHSAGTWTISPAAGNRLPTILVPVTIDGTTQPGTAANTAQAPNPMDGRLAVQLSGASDSVTSDWDGLVLGAGSSGSEIRGLSFTGWDNDASDAILVWGSSDNVIAGNYFGVRADGTAAGDGVNAGVGIAGGGADNRVGGTAPGDRNLFSNDTASGNAWAGVWVSGSTTTGAIIQGNEFGFGIGGMLSPGGYAGVHAFDGATALIGGVQPGSANRITGRMSAVVVQGQTIASLLGNGIWGNSGIGVDLSADGVTTNDAGDVDTGANDLLNFPVITSASESNGRVDIGFNLDVPAGNYRVEFFTNPSGADPTGYGEGETFVHAVAISHTGSGAQTFTAGFAGTLGDVVTATVTEDLGAGAYGSTSEYSRAYTASAGATVLDRSGRRTDLRTAGGTPVSGAGAAGSGITFAGGDERLVGPATDLTSGAITLSAWVSLDAAATAPRLISKRAGGGAIYELLVDDATGEAVAKFDIGGAQISVQGGSLTIGDWHQVAATWDGTTVRLYVDGTEVAQTAASGTLGTDLAAPLIVGNVADASRGLAGSVDVVELAHTARSAAWIETAYLNVSDPSGFVSVGEVQLAAPGTWAASSAVVRSGSGALAAPAATAGAEAWTTVTGLDEPGLAFDSWWYVTAPATSNVAAGTNTGPSPVEQRELGSTGGTVDLATRLVGGRTVDVGSGASVSPATWTRVEIRTDELGRSSAWIGGVQVIGPTVHSGGTSAGSAGLRAGTLGAGGWYVDDVRIRRYVSDEPTTTLGPLHRN